MKLDSQKGHNKTEMCGLILGMASINSSGICDI